MTPISLIPSKALGRRGKRSRPPRTMVSDVSARDTCSVLKMVEEKDLCVCSEIIEMSEQERGGSRRCIIKSTADYIN